MRAVYIVRLKLLTTLLVLTTIFSSSVIATTIIVSDNGHPWDIYDIGDSDTGGISDGGNDAFDNWGKIRIRTMDGANAILSGDVELSSFGLTVSGRRVATTTPQTVDDIQVSRAMYAPTGTDYMRYIDTFTNTGANVRKLQVAWGGDLGSDSATTLGATSSGDLSIAADDAWALTFENSGHNIAGPATDPTIGYVLQDPGTSQFSSTGEYDNTPFDTAWPGNGNDDISFVFIPITLNPGESVSLAYFLYRGLEENRLGPLGQNPVTGEEIALAKTILADLAANPDFGDLSQSELNKIINWSGAAPPSLPATAIPTLPQWALILLVLGIGLTVFSRQKKLN